jgi:nucleoside-diphosphate-sugar epimerase
MRRVLVTGSSGHLGEALMRALSDRDVDAVGLDVRPPDWTHVVGSVADTRLAREVMARVDVVLHTATLHKPQLAFRPAWGYLPLAGERSWTGTSAPRLPCSTRRSKRASRHS